MSAAVQQSLVALALVVLVLVSALAVVGSTHDSRALYTQLQEREAARWHLEEEYSRLLLEQSTLASHHRIEREADGMLGLAPPTHDRTRLVNP